jgi:hypothetical protein
MTFRSWNWEKNRAGFSPIKLLKTGLKTENIFNFLIHELAEGIPSEKVRGNKDIFITHLLPAA